MEFEYKNRKTVRIDHLTPGEQFSFEPESDKYIISPEAEHATRIKDGMVTNVTRQSAQVYRVTAEAKEGLLIKDVPRGELFVFSADQGKPKPLVFQMGGSVPDSDGEETIFTRLLTGGTEYVSEWDASMVCLVKATMVVEL